MFSFSLWLSLLSCLCVRFVASIPIDNGVEGEPEIECAANSITVSFNTRNEFAGHVYVKGRFAEPGCKSDEAGRRVASIKLGFDQCGTQRSRSLNPKGVTVTNTVVITFHPQFLTKVDRAYTIQCFYMEADKTVSQDLEVSEITTAFQTQTVPMPVCQYDILDGGPEGQPVKFATIGQQVYHKWTCTTETTDIFCAVVHSCFVDDGAGNHQQLLDENGCAIDRFLLQNLEYPSDLMAGREAHVFKYADKPALFFQCQVTISIKEPGQQCSRPQCGDPGGAGAGVGGSRPPSGSVPPVTAPSVGASTRATGPRGTGPPAGRPPAPVPASPAPGRGSSPRSVVAPLAGRGLFLAPLQALLATSSVSPSFAPITRPSFAVPAATIPPAASSAAAPSTPRPAPPPANPAAPAAAVPAASVPPNTPPPRPAPTSPRAATPADSINPSQLNVPVNLGPAAAPDAGAGFDFPDRRRRLKRSPVDASTDAIAGVWDVRAQQITALDIDDDILDDSLNRRLSKKRNGSLSEATSYLENRQKEPGFCLSPIAFGLFLAFVIAFSIFTAMIGVLYCLRRSSK